MDLSSRPSTSKPRGICKYYTSPRGCFAGDRCKFLHGDKAKLTPYDQAKTCWYYARGYCKNGDKCWFQHVQALQRSDVDPVDELCSICFEKPVLYGLLSNCNHIFCISCLKSWRDPQSKSIDMVHSHVHKKCPMCRAPSAFVTPSSVFYQSGDEKKEEVMRAYKESMARVGCRYFIESKSQDKQKPFCPFGRDCFYQHLNDDGTPYVFREGVKACMRRASGNRTRFTSDTSLGLDIFADLFANVLSLGDDDDVNNARRNVNPNSNEINYLITQNVVENGNGFWNDAGPANRNGTGNVNGTNGNPALITRFLNDTHLNHISRALNEMVRGLSSISEPEGIPDDEISTNAGAGSGADANSTLPPNSNAPTWADLEIAGEGAYWDRLWELNRQPPTGDGVRVTVGDEIGAAALRPNGDGNENENGQREDTTSPLRAHNARNSASAPLTDGPRGEGDGGSDSDSSMPPLHDVSDSEESGNAWSDSEDSSFGFEGESESLSLSSPTTITTQAHPRSPATTVTFVRSNPSIPANDIPDLQQGPHLPLTISPLTTNMVTISRTTSPTGGTLRTTAGTGAPSRMGGRTQRVPPRRLTPEESSSAPTSTPSPDFIQTTTFPSLTSAIDMTSVLAPAFPELSHTTRSSVRRGSASTAPAPAMTHAARVSTGPGLLSQIPRRQGRLGRRASRLASTLATPALSLPSSSASSSTSASMPVSRPVEVDAVDNDEGLSLLLCSDRDEILSNTLTENAEENGSTYLMEYIPRLNRVEESTACQDAFGIDPDEVQVEGEEQPPPPPPPFTTDGRGRVIAAAANSDCDASNASERAGDRLGTSQTRPEDESNGDRIRDGNGSGRSFLSRMLDVIF